MNPLYLNILILEDEWFNAQYIKKSLESFGHKSDFIVDNAKDALKIIQSNQIDLAFFDININGSIDGIECAKIMNENYSIPIIYISAYNDNQTKEEARLTNSYGFIAKPFDKEDIKQALNIFFKKIETDNEKSYIIQLGNNYCFNKKFNKLCYKEEEIKLTKRELKLISFLSKKVNITIKSEEIIFYIWQENKQSSILRDLIFRLHKKLPLFPLKNIHGLGYILWT